MSHSVTIRTQTVTSSSSMIVINTGYLKTWSGILKLLELVCVSLLLYIYFAGCLIYSLINLSLNEVIFKCIFFNYR